MSQQEHLQACLKKHKILNFLSIWEVVLPLICNDPNLCISLPRARSLGRRAVFWGRAENCVTLSVFAEFLNKSRCLLTVVFIKKVLSG